MLSTTTSAYVLIGLATSLVAAAPAGRFSTSTGISRTTSAPSYTWDTSFPTEVSPDGENFRYPLSNSFPTPSPDQIKDINQAAGGTLSNLSPPAEISADGITNLQFVAFNELFEVAFFTDLLKNVTNNVEGYEVPEGFTREFLIETLATVQAQEELHALNANNGLVKIAKVTPISPCEYVFPVTTFLDAVVLAQTFTDVTLGTLQDIITVFANADDTGFVRGVAAALGNEGEQNGFFRLLQGKRPSAQPFLTASARNLAFSALNQNFVVEGSCPDINAGRIDLRIFEPLTLEQEVVEPRNQLLTFSVEIKSSRAQGEGQSRAWTSAGGSTDGLRLVLVNGQNKPVVSELENVQIQDDRVTFQAPFNFEDDLLFGLTIAAVVKGDSFANITDVENATVFGPALIEVL